MMEDLLLTQTVKIQLPGGEGIEGVDDRQTAEPLQKVTPLGPARL